MISIQGFGAFLATGSGTILPWFRNRTEIDHGIGLGLDAAPSRLPHNARSGARPTLAGFFLFGDA